MSQKFKIALTISVFTAFLYVMPAAAYEPEARLTFTFDDVNDRIYTKAAPLFLAKSMPAVLYAETGPLNSGEDWVMTWDQVRELRDRFGWEIGSHTINHLDLTQVTDEVLETELAGSKKSFADNGIAVETFATPMGRYDNRVLEAIRKHYSSHRAAWGGWNIWPYNEYEIVAMEVTHKTSPAKVKQWIDHAILHKQWLVLLFHDVVDGTPKQYEYKKSNLKKIIDYAASKPIKISTISEVIKSSQNPPDENLMPTNGWTSNNPSAVQISPGILRITGSASQNTAMSPLVPIAGSGTYGISYYARTDNWAGGGTAAWVNEFDANKNWLGGQWLGGRYEPINGTLTYPFVPSSPLASFVELHLFTEENSSMDLYIDQISMISI